MHNNSPSPFRDIALWRFGVISPLLHCVNDGISLNQELEKLAKNTFYTPDGKARQFSSNTFRDWLYLYKRQGLNGLMGKERGDKGSSSISLILQEKFRMLRGEYPARTTKRLLKVLKDSGAWC